MVIPVPLWKTVTTAGTPSWKQMVVDQDAEMELANAKTDFPKLPGRRTTELQKTPTTFASKAFRPTYQSIVLVMLIPKP